jgi:2-polyprenyl-3-methyl-5-hydroxy-6-metoxy-1,4-benzoquinol methylase
MDNNKTFDTTRAEQFAGNLVDTYNKASLTMIISLGHRSGLFDNMAGQQPSTSQQIADLAKLNERYVREWLGAMVAGGVVEYSAENKSYKLPDEHAAFLTRAAGADNFAVFAEFIFAVAENGDNVLNCFKNGGGITYDKFHRFYHAMDEDQSIIGTFFSQFLPSTPALTEQLEKGISVLDAGCGTGGLLNRLASEFPNSRFTGLDLTEYAIEIARDNAKKKGLTNIEFLIQDLTNFDEAALPDQYDLVMTIDAIHDQQKPINVLMGLKTTLKPGGTYLMVDINGTGHLHKDAEMPFAQLLYSISCMHCVPVSLGQGGDGLGAMWGEEKIREYISTAGFADIETKNFETDPLNNWFLISK